jgi:hypothetical protein
MAAIFSDGSADGPRARGHELLRRASKNSMQKLENTSATMTPRVIVK